MNNPQYEAILNQYEWIEEDYRRHKEEQRRITARTEAYLSLGKYIRTRSTKHRQSALAIVKLCTQLGYLTDNESDQFLYLLKK